MNHNRAKRSSLHLEWLLALSLPLPTGCATTTESAPAASSAAESALEKLAAPPSLEEAERLFQEKKYEQLSLLLDKFRPKNQSEKVWQRYFLGQAQMELGSLERGLKLLETNYALLRDESESLSVDDRRIAARSLKRIGWYFRQKKEFEKAYAYHHLQYLYLQGLSTPAELHDALLSLDVDSYELRQNFASEHWLRESLRVAEGISDPAAKARALAMSYNNLADTLRIQRRWEEATAAIARSREHWNTYDKLVEASENRELWALLQSAEIYGAWAKALRKDDEASRDEADEKIEWARDQAREALHLAENLEINAAERADLENRVRAFGLTIPRRENKNQKKSPGTQK